MPTPIQTTVFNVIQSLVAGRCYPNVAPDSPVAPYIVYQRVVTANEVTLSGQIPVQQTRFQVDVYHNSALEASNLADQVSAAMIALPQSVFISAQDQYEPDVKLHRVIHDYSIWHY